MHGLRYLVVKTHALMIHYTPASQLTLEGFEHPFDSELDPSNRWVVLAGLIPWDELAAIYAHDLRSDSGRETVDIRMVIGALIVKHRLKLSDRDTVDEIAENIYTQYFCGLTSFQTGRPFDASLFVDIRKRMGADKFDAFNDVVIKRTENLKPKRKRILREKQEDKNPPVGEVNPGDEVVKEDVSQMEESPVPPNKGKLKIDATVADQQVVYPTDLGLLNRSREEAERIIDLLYEKNRDELKEKPRTYRRVARQRYLGIAKKKKKGKQEIRKAIGQQLRYVKRNIRTIGQLLDMFLGDNFPLNHRDQKILWVITHIYEQQKFMYDNKVHSHPDRVVNIYQPYVRPIVRGKDKARVEFGSKISISEYEGMSKVDHISWDAFNEAVDLQMQVEQYRKTFGCYPELLLADGIYLNRSNRKWLKDKHIRIVGKPLGRPPKEQLTPYQKRKQRKERNQRNLVEGKIGQGKNGYGLNKIKARRQDTSESWIGAIFFVMNLVNMTKVWSTSANVRCGLFLILTLASQLFFRFFQWVKNQCNRGAQSIINIIFGHAALGLHTNRV